MTAKQRQACENELQWLTTTLKIKLDEVAQLEEKIKTIKDRLNQNENESGQGTQA